MEFPIPEFPIPTCWVFLALLGAVCFAWMHLVIRRMMRKQVPDLVRRVEGPKP
jgi:hypothetical protein